MWQERAVYLSVHWQRQCWVFLQAGKFKFRRAHRGGGLFLGRAIGDLIIPA